MRTDKPSQALREGGAIHLGLTLMCALILGIVMSAKDALSYLAGAIIIAADVFSFVLVWWLAFEKKAVAGALLTVVSKYAFLGISIYVLIVRLDMPVPAFVAGVATIIGTTVCYTLRYSLKEKKNNASTL